MRKKLEGNGLWESSRMMLPEHAKRIQKFNGDVYRPRPEKPVLDEQELELIQAAIAESIAEQTPIKLKISDPYDDYEVEGIVQMVKGGQLVIGSKAVRLKDITGIE